MKQKILLVEDEQAIADTVIYALQGEGYQVHWTTLGQEALQSLHEDEDIRMVLLDVGLPDGNGFEFCKQIRTFSQVPVMFLTARNEEIDRIVGLEIGADDYVSKPFSPREVAARVKAILKRSARPLKEPAVTGTTLFEVDEARARIFYHGSLLDLTRYEYLILQHLLEHPEHVLSRQQLMDRVWTEPDASLERAVDTHIKTLRAKLRAVRSDLEPIKTHRGLGYSLQVQRLES